jgi:hypothetical protein
MLIPTPSRPTPATQGHQSRRSLIVPVDAFPRSRETVRRAISLAREAPSRIVLVALLPPPRPVFDPDPLEVQAAMLAGELGLGFVFWTEPSDEETRVCRTRDLVLAPLRALVDAAGLPVELRVLRGDNFGGQLRELVRTVPDAVLVLDNPLKLHEALHDVTGELLIDAPCRLCVAGVDQPAASRRESLLSRLGRRLRGGAP